MFTFKNVMSFVLFNVVAISSMAQLSATDRQRLRDARQLLEIINGTPVTPEHPLAGSVVGLLRQFEDFDGTKIWMASCTGTVLSNKFILTAAHCVANQTAQEMAINFSVESIDNSKQRNPSTRITDIEKSFTIRYVKGFIAHPEYRRGAGHNDLAVIALNDQAPSSAKPVNLMPDNWVDVAANKTMLDGQKWQVRLMGYGLIQEAPATRTEVLRETIVPARFENDYVITDQTGGSGGCSGDSGGPLFIEYLGQTYQAGVTHGPHDGSTTCGEEGQWVNPALDKAFIKESIASLKKLKKIKITK